MSAKQHTLTRHRRFCLLDANLVAGYYLPESLSSERARERIKRIIDAVRSKPRLDLFLYIPNFCIAEVLAVFSKYHWATWEKKVRRAFPRKMDRRKYTRMCDRFHNDIHNGVVMQQVELNRYHVLATDLISPVDAYYQYYRHRSGGKKYRKAMMSATDHLIIGTGIYLTKIHSRTNFVILTADNRLGDIVYRATGMKRATAKKLGLIEKAEALGLQWSSETYPQVLNLAKVSDCSLREFFGQSPFA